MQKDSQVSARDLQNLTDFSGVHSFDLTHDEGHPLVGWNPVPTAVYSLAHLGSVDLCVHRERWPRPTPVVASVYRKIEQHLGKAPRPSLAGPTWSTHLTGLMTNAVERPPNEDHLALVLSGGGARAAYQIGILSAIAERFPELRIAILTGVSAGAINSAYLAAHCGTFGSAVSDLRAKWAELTPDLVYCVRPGSMVRAALRWLLYFVIGRRAEPGVVQGLMEMGPLRRFLDGCIDFGGIDENVRAGRLRAAALTTTSYTTGQTVTFVHGGPGCPIWERSQRIGITACLALDHIMASSAIPIIFPAVKMPDGFYGDGSVRQLAPLAPAIHLGATRILAISVRAESPSRLAVRSVGEYPAMAEVMGLLFNTIFLDALEADAERLERINLLLKDRPEGIAGPDGLKPVELLMLRPSRDLGALARGYEDRLPAKVRWVVNSMGGKREGSSDLISYLLFDPAFTDMLVELGYNDAHGQWDKIEDFLGDGALRRGTASDGEG